MRRREVLLVVPILVGLALTRFALAEQLQTIVISGGGASEKGSTSRTDDISLSDFHATVNVSQASALLTWMQAIFRKEVVATPISIQLEGGKKLEFLEPKITEVVVTSDSKSVVLKIKHRDGMLILTVPKVAWDSSWPPPKK